MNGSVVKRGSTWSLVYRVKDPATGKRKQVWKGGFASKKLAEAELRRRLVDVDDGIHGDRSPTTVARYIETVWLPRLAASLALGKIKPATYADYERSARTYVIPTVGHIELEHLTAAHLTTAYGTLLRSGGRNGQGLSPKSVAHVHKAVSRLLADAMRDDKVKRNVAHLADAPSGNSGRVAIWQSEELRTFLDATRNDRTYPLWLLLATTGVRRGEAAGLRWSSVDLERGRVTISEARVVVDHVVMTSTPKTDRGRRTIAIDPVTVAALRSWRAKQAEERLAAGPAWQDSDHVFTWEDGQPFHPNVITRTFKRLAKNAGLQPIRLHALRHSYATAAIEAGVDVKVLSERLGHASIGITLDIYGHVLERQDAAAADAAAAFILGRT